jgi:hypothetical protein
VGNGTDLSHHGRCLQCPRAAPVDVGFARFDKHGYVRYWWMDELNWEGAEGEKLFRRHIEELLAEQ